MQDLLALHVTLLTQKVCTRLLKTEWFTRSHCKLVRDKHPDELLMGSVLVWAAAFRMGPHILLRLRELELLFLGGEHCCAGYMLHINGHLDDRSAHRRTVSSGCLLRVEQFYRAWHIRQGAPDIVAISPRIHFSTVNSRGAVQ